jgi:hypothetical protein
VLDRTTRKDHGSAWGALKQPSFFALANDFPQRINSREGITGTNCTVPLPAIPILIWVSWKLCGGVVIVLEIESPRKSGTAPHEKKLGKNLLAAMQFRREGFSFPPLKRGKSPPRSHRNPGASRKAFSPPPLKRSQSRRACW